MGFGWFGWFGWTLLGFGDALAGDYAFVSSHDSPVVSLFERFPTPAGFVRVETAEDSFGAWLRMLPVSEGPPVVRTSKGHTVGAPALATVPLDLGSGDLQQCADSAIRLYAEYRWDTGRTESLAFHFTSGDRSDWSDWLKGERFDVSGPHVARSFGAPRPPNRTSYRAWLQHTFVYAGTRSLRLDAESVEDDEPLRPGDLLVDPGSPGHAVVLLDVATSDSGERIGLIGQGFMPAQTFHVLSPERGHGRAGWFSLPMQPSGFVKTPSWRAFSRADALRFSR
jgi:hypothetical protein